MSKIKVLIVDDSKFFQEMLADILESDDELEVAGTADNGEEAIDRVKTLKPDVVTMDISMPKVGGLETIVNIMADSPVPILVISDIQDSHVAFTALKKGALEVLSKTEIQQKNSPEFLRKLKLLSKVKVIRHIRGKVDDKESPLAEETDFGFEWVVTIVSSTGGPRALSIVLSSLPEDFPCPILIAQHIDHGFIDGLVEFMNNDCPLNVMQGTQGEKIAAGNVYVSPADKHMVVDDNGRIDFIAVDTNDIYHPSCNRLLSSAGRVFKEKNVGVILTGMGDDGAEGITCIKEHGGVTIAQDEDSSVIFGMPQVAIDSGCVDRVLPLKEIGSYIISLTKTKAQHQAKSL